MNIANLESTSLPSPRGAALYRLSILGEVPETTSPDQLAVELDEAAAGIGVDVTLERA